MGNLRITISYGRRGHPGVVLIPFTRGIMRLASFSLVFTFLFLSSSGLRAELVSLDIRERQPFANGIGFGNSGPCVKITGVARFAIDPKNPRNKAIVDLHL